MDKMDNDLGNTAQKLNIKQHEHYLNYLWTHVLRRGQG
jgi:hypothetical protein